MSGPSKPGPANLGSNKAFPQRQSSIGNSGAWHSSQTSPRPPSTGPGPLRSTSAIPLPSFKDDVPSSRIAVVLNSPRHAAQYESVRDDEGADDLVISDLSPQYKRKAAETRGPLHQQSLPLQKGKPGTTSLALPTRAPATDRRSASTNAKVPSKARGRPKGWKRGLSYADVRNHGVQIATQKAILEPRPLKLSGTKPAKLGRPPKPKDKDALVSASASASAGVPKRRGRPPRMPTPPPREIYERLKPYFITFKCEWEGCPAELHNLDTLRRHVHVVHCEGQTDAPRCMWRKCAVATLVDNKRRFEDVAALISHTEEEHIIPFSWHVGDGPKTCQPGVAPEDYGSDDKIPDFLMDEHGKQVTPSIQGQAVESFVDWQVRRRKLKEMLQRMNDALPDPGSSSEDAEA